MTADYYDTHDLSPSILHGRLMDEAPQTLSYRGGDVHAWQPKLKRKVRQLLGGFSKERPHLDVRHLWTHQIELGTIHKIVFTSVPGSDVPAYVCLPANAAAPYAWMICVQGHNTGMHNSIGAPYDYDQGKPIETAYAPTDIDNDFGLGCMRRGVAALCIEQRSFGERRERRQQLVGGDCHDAAAHALMLGRTLLGERVFDVDRAIDYLMTRDDVDSRAVGVMGSSRA